MVIGKIASAEGSQGGTALSVAAAADVRPPRRRTYRKFLDLGMSAGVARSVRGEECERSGLLALRAALRRDPAVREIARSWRRLTGRGGRRAGPGAPTLVACSGGADSSALVLALWAAAGSRRRRGGAGGDRDGAALVVGHVVHDLRAREESLADRDAAKTLADRLGLEFADAEVSARTEGGNAEGSARRLRYEALSRMAAERGVGFIATAHHAGDQLETVMMGLVRGAGPRGLAGVAARRSVGRAGQASLNGAPGSPAARWSPDEARIVRPMLGVSRADLERICRAAGWAWREDRTNRDTARLRAAVRHGVVPSLGALPLRGGIAGVERRAARAAALLRDAARVVEDRAEDVWGRRITAEPGRITWWRRDLRGERAIVVGAVLRRAAAAIRGGRGLDRFTGLAVEPCVRAVRGRSTDPKVFEWSGVRVRVTAHEVSVEPEVQGR
jgi:tRNA(Ile)-lysidine synthase